MRLSRSLAGSWGFLVDPSGTAQIDSLTTDREITVPLPWQAAFPDLQQYSGYAWYQRSFELDSQWLDGEVLLQFGAVDYWCQVFVNGQLCGEHEGGYTPFTFAIRQYLQTGTNSVSVRVYDPAQDKIKVQRWFHDPKPLENQPPFEAELLPHGKQEWYYNVGGIWQDVQLTAVPTTYIKHVKITPDIHSGTAHVQVEIAGGDAKASLRVEIDGQRASIRLVAGQTSYSLALQISTPQLWTPETPHLYSAIVTLDNGDTITERFGFREIKIHKGQLLLNGEPVILLSALDQDFYPETIYTVPSDDFLRDQFRKAKELGLNSLRCHIKVPDPRYLDLADEIGLLIWTEIPSWRTFHPKTTSHPTALFLDDVVKNRARQTLHDMIERDYNHPSLIIYSIVNEDWGTALLLSEADRKWLVEMVDYCKSLDATRLVVDNSPCPNSWGMSIHVKTDIDDFHLYTNIPDAADTWEQFIEQFAMRPTWTFTTDGLAQRSGEEALILSEFGNWGMPLLKNIAANGEPDWFKLGPWWSSWDGEPGYPNGVVDRFKRLGLDRIWPDYDSFAEATQWHQFAALKFEIEAMRRQSSIVGYVITELSDIYWESNGLLDFERNPKAYHDQFRTFNTPNVVVPQLKRYAYWDDETVEAQLYASHYDNADWSQARLQSSLGSNEAEQSMPVLERGETQHVGSASWPLTPVQKSGNVSLKLRLENRNGQLLAHNDTPLLVMPAADRAASFSGAVAAQFRPQRYHNDASAEAATSPLNALGYQVSSQLTDSTQLLISDFPTQEQLNWVSQGGDLLFLSSGSNAFFWSGGRGGAYSGNWMTCFSWLRPGVYRRLNVSNPLTSAFIDMMPQSVILGLPVNDASYQEDFLAGQITGWVGHPAPHTIQFRYGAGRVIMTGYRLQDKWSYHPVAIAMLHDLVDHLTSDRCQPTLQAKL